MKKIIIAAAITTVFSTMATANSGLADRFNETRSYPNNTVESVSARMTGAQHKQVHMNMSKSVLEHHLESSDSTHFKNARPKKF